MGLCMLLAVTDGQLGDGTTTNRSTPTQILSSGVAQIAAGANHSLIIKNDSLHAFGKNLGNSETATQPLDPHANSLLRRRSNRRRILSLPDSQERWVLAYFWI